MKRSELLLEVPQIGEVLLEPFKYSNGRLGYMAITDKLKFNITLNIDSIDEKIMILKMYDDAEVVNRHLLSKTDMFTKGDSITIGRNYAYKVKLNKDYGKK